MQAAAADETIPSLPGRGRGSDGVTGVHAYGGLRAVSLVKRL